MEISSQRQDQARSKRLTSKSEGVRSRCLSNEMKRPIRARGCWLAGLLVRMIENVAVASLLRT